MANGRRSAAQGQERIYVAFDERIWILDVGDRAIE